MALLLVCRTPVVFYLPPLASLKPNSKRKTDTWTEKELASQLKRAQIQIGNGGKKSNIGSSSPQAEGKTRQKAASSRKEGTEKARHEATRRKAVEEAQSKRKRDRPAAHGGGEREQASSNGRETSKGQSPAVVKGNGAHGGVAHNSSQPTPPLLPENKVGDTLSSIPSSY